MDEEKKKSSAEKEAEEQELDPNLKLDPQQLARVIGGSSGSIRDVHYTDTVEISEDTKKKI